MRHIVITLPAKTSWAEYAQELQAVADRSSVMNFKLPSKPKESGKGARCYLIFQGKLVGYMEITDIVYRDAFTCATTGNYWAAGTYVQRTGPFYFFLAPPEMTGIRGYRYYDTHHGQEEFIKSFTGERPDYEKIQQARIDGLRCSKKGQQKEAAAVGLATECAHWT